jgi:hypothetical protein
MAFIRRYAAQGDPYPRTVVRAGRLVRAAAGRPRIGPGVTYGSQRFVIPSHPGGYRRVDPVLGDPFLGKMFKGIRKAAKKITLKGVAKGIGTVARFAAPLALPGVGGLLAGALFNRGGASPEPVEASAPAAPEPTPQTFDEDALRALFAQWYAEQQAAQAPAYWPGMYSARVPDFYGGY